MKILVTGCGSIGRRHVRNLCSMRGVDVFAHDITAEGRQTVSDLFGIKTYEDYNDALAAYPDAVIVATPTNEHIEPTLIAARAGCHIFIEKPVSHDLDGLSELSAAVRERDLITLVGCNMRFHPGIKMVKALLEKGEIGKVLSADIESGSYLPGWRPTIDYAKTYSAQRGKGGGVILDAIHEIDYARWMLGDVQMVACMADKISPLDLDVEDVADIVLRFYSGAIGHIHLDYVQRAYSRGCKFVGENGVIKWDFNEDRTGLFHTEGKEWIWFKQPEGYDLNQMYIDEMKHFTNCIKGMEAPTLDIFGGVEDLKIALAARESAQTRKFIPL